ncbi:MAG TPA: hypothetical protein VMI35_14310 [Puia sp.]|nr:hypothetical protein [Puia sp.]
MFKKLFFHALLSAVLSTMAGIIYCRIYFFATEVDFSRVINPASLAGMNTLICMLAAGINRLLAWLFKKNGEKLFTLLFSILSFSTVVIPISISLPLDIKQPELFPGLAVPLVFFPAMAWFTLGPWFRTVTGRQ